MSNPEYSIAYRKSRSEKDILPVLDQNLIDTLPHVFIGTLEIPLEMVIGTSSVSRANSFAKNWMPLLEEESEFAMKWSRLYTSQVDEGIRDPIQVYEYMRTFYVREGNKRVAVLKYLQAPSVVAEITRLMPIPDGTNEFAVYKEFLQFQKVTGLYMPCFTMPGSYQLLAEMLEQDLKIVWPQDLIRTFQGAFYRFETIAKEVIKKSDSINLSDSFLIYLSIFTFDSLLDQNRSILQKRIERIRSEFYRNESQVELEYKMKPQSVLSLLNLRKKSYSERNPLRIAFLYASADISDYCTAAFEAGRAYLNNRYEGVVHTDIYTGCRDSSVIEQAIQQAVKTSEWIITTNSSMLKETLKAATDYPDNKFMNHCIPLVSHIINTYALRTYELYFLMGVLAGVVHNGQPIYYLTAENEETLIDLNAFALGVAWTSADQKVILTDTQDFPQNAIVLNNRRGNHHKQGLYRIDEHHYEVMLAAPLYNWPIFYEMLIRDILTHNEISAQSYWLGLSSKAIELYLTKDLSDTAKRTTEHFADNIKAGNISPFSGPIHDRCGNNILANREIMHTKDIIKINWINHNIEGSISSDIIHRDELTEIK